MDERKQQSKTRLKQACSTTCKGTNKGTAVFEPAGTTTSCAHGRMPTGCCGVLVPHTGFPVKRLMCLSRVQPAHPRDA